MFLICIVTSPSLWLIFSLSLKKGILQYVLLNRAPHFSRQTHQHHFQLRPCVLSSPSLSQGLSSSHLYFFFSWVLKFCLLHLRHFFLFLCLVWDRDQFSPFPIQITNCSSSNYQTDRLLSPVWCATSLLYQSSVHAWFFRVI